MSGDNKTSNSQSDLQISSLAQHKLDFACGPVIDFRACIATRQWNNGISKRFRLEYHLIGPVGVAAAGSTVLTLCGA